MYVSKRTPRSEVEPRRVGNNSVIVSGRDGVRFECVSNSSRDGIGTITSPSSATLRAGGSTEQLKITSEKPGVLTVETKEAVSLSDREQGIYTCTMPDSSGTDVVLNVGVYPSGFNGECVQWNLSNPDTNGAEESVIVSEVSSISEVEMHARVVLGVGKGVLFREVSSVQECPHRERGSTVYYTHI